MRYFDEKGNVIQEDDIDLAKGYLLEKAVVMHEAVTHTMSREYHGKTISFEVIDKPAWTEVTEQTYIRYKAVSEPDGYIHDEVGNKYEQVIVDGELKLKLVESADGIMNI